MGLSSRDYYRESTPPAWSFGTAPVVKYIIIANIVVFLLQILIVRTPTLWNVEDARQLTDDQDYHLTERQVSELMRALPRVSVVQEWFQLDTNKVVEKGQVWRLLTHAFCHDRHNILHIVFNMLFLFWFGRTLESMYGSREFLLFYLTAAVCAALAYVALDLYTGSPIPAVGASGAVMAVVMLYTMHFPTEEIYICFIIPIQMRWLMVLFVIWDLHPVLLALAGDGQFTGVAHAAHLGGLAFGFLYAHYHWRLEKIGEHLPGLRWRSTPRLRVYPSSRISLNELPDTDSERLDQILEKIFRSGQDSLTEEERKILRASSEQLKSKRGRKG